MRGPVPVAMLAEPLVPDAPAADAVDVPLELPAASSVVKVLPPTPVELKQVLSSTGSALSEKVMSAH